MKNHKRLKQKYGKKIIVCFLITKKKGLLKSLIKTLSKIDKEKARPKRGEFNILNE